jgi:hypothetical protein
VYSGFSYIFEKNKLMKKILILISGVLIFMGCSTNNNGTVTVIPLAPTNLSGSVISTTQINLSWTDNATNEDGYKIERKTGNGNYAVVGSMGANLTTFNDLGLTTNTTYTYRVFAYNSVGNSLQYSNELTLTTQDSIPSWLTNGLVGYWPFNGNANDESGNGNDGTVYGATLTIDRFGSDNKAYSFNGSYTYIDCGQMSNLGNYPNSLTENAWILAAINQSNYCKMPLISKRQTGNNGWATLGAGGNGTRGVPWNNQAYFFVNAPNYIDGITNALFSNSLTNDNVWHMLTGVKSGYDYKIYFDGILQDSTTDIYPNLGSTDNMLFGHESIWGFSCEQWYNGKLDDVRIYNRALSQSEITYLATH